MNRTIKIGVVVALLIAVGVVVAVKRGGSRLGAGSSADPPASDESQAGSPRLVDIGRGQCIPCKMMAPILEELKEEYAGRMRVEVYDLTEDPSARERFDVRMIPTQIFYDAGGNELWRHEGFLSKEDILAKWNQLGVDLSSGTSTERGAHGSEHEAW